MEKCVSLSILQVGVDNRWTGVLHTITTVKLKCTIGKV
jgi:hypothetical protein